MFQVLFYKTQSGNNVVRDFILSLPEQDKRKFGEDLMVLQFGYPMGMPLCRPLGKGLVELRISLPSKREARMILYFDSDAQALIGLHAFIKKTQKTPKADLDVARDRKAEFQMKGG